MKLTTLLVVILALASCTNKAPKEPTLADQIKNNEYFAFTKEKALEIGVNQYLGKPYQEEDLMKNINKILEA